MKRIVVLVLAIAMLCSMIAFSSAEEHEPVTIEFLCWGAVETTTAPAFTAMINGFMAKFPRLQLK